MNSDGSGVTPLTSDPEMVPLYPVWAPVPYLLIGEDYVITELGANLNLRDSPSLDGEILQKLQIGEVVKILEEPVEVDDFFWRRMRVEAENIEGWAVEVAGWYKKVE
jgi:uncharacterized protein YgiM (DUF1202 family)